MSGEFLNVRLTERFLDTFQVFFLKFGFGLLSSPRGSFGTKPSSIDVKNLKEYENRTHNPQTNHLFLDFSEIKILENLSKNRTVNFFLSLFWGLLF